MASPDLDLYAVLRVTPQATPDEIRSACRLLAAACHPDIQPPDKEAWASEQMFKLNTTRDLLLDPRWRARYQATPAATPRRRAERDRWRKRAAQAAYANSGQRQSASTSARLPVRRLVYALSLIGVLGFGLYNLPLLLEIVLDPGAAAQTLAGAEAQFLATLINVGHSLLAAAEVVLVAVVLAFIVLRWSRRRKP